MVNAKDVYNVYRTIDEIVRAFNWGSLVVSESSREDHLKVELAPSFGGLTKDSIKLVDNTLKIAIAGVHRDLSKLQPRQRTWQAIQAILNQSPFLVPVEEYPIVNSGCYTKEGDAWFKFDGSPDQAIVQEVDTWYRKLINDEDVLNFCGIDIQVLENIVAWSGATISSVETIFYKRETHDKTMVDIGIMRYPNINDPHFNVYRIQLHAWSKCDRILMYQRDGNGITGNYTHRRYKPNNLIIDQMNTFVQEKAVNEAEHAFDD